MVTTKIEASHLSQLQTLNRRVFELETELKDLHHNMGESISYQTARSHELLSGQSTILKFLREVAFKPPSPPHPHAIPSTPS